MEMDVARRMEKVELQKRARKEIASKENMTEREIIVKRTKGKETSFGKCQSGRKGHWY